MADRRRARRSQRRRPREHQKCRDQSLLIPIPIKERLVFAEAPQPGSQSDVSAADAVVADFDREPAVAVCDCHRGVRRGGVLGDVGQRLGDDEVGGQLDLLGELSATGAGSWIARAPTEAAGETLPPEKVAAFRAEGARPPQL